MNKEQYKILIKKKKPKEHRFFNVFLAFILFILYKNSQNICKKAKKKRLFINFSSLFWAAGAKNSSKPKKKRKILPQFLKKCRNRHNLFTFLLYNIS